MNEAATRQRFLFISNGHGEDAIAAQMVARLPAGASAEAFPMIGGGRAYNGICQIVGPRATLASEGWRNVKGSLRRDIVTGGLGTIAPVFRFLRSIQNRYDRIIVVGDMMGVLACLATGNRDLLYIDVYKTGSARLYSKPERWAIAKICALVFCRAENLAEMLRVEGVDARCAGNVMMDTIPRGQYDAATRRSKPHAVTLLPGSRALTAESFALQIEAIRLLPETNQPDIFLAVAGNVSIDDLAKAAGLGRTSLLSSDPDDLGQLTDGKLVVHMARGRAMGNLVEASDVVLSQAGTASVQALGLGKPVITFRNPRDRQSRFESEQRLFGIARVVRDAERGQVSDALGLLLRNDAERARLGEMGRERIGGPGALAAIFDAMGVAAPA